MDISDKKVAILVHNYFEQAEFEKPIAALRNAGAEVDVVSAGPLNLRGMNHVDMADHFEADVLLKDAAWDEYDALVLPGGVVNADQLRTVEAAQEWVADFLEAGKPVAAICHAPWLLVSAEVAANRRMTSYFTLEDDIRNAGAEWADQPVIVDDNLITSRKPADLDQFNDALISALSRQPTNPDRAAIYDRQMTTQLWV